MYIDAVVDNQVNAIACRYKQQSNHINRQDTLSSNKKWGMKYGWRISNVLPRTYIQNTSHTFWDTNSILVELKMV